MSESGSVGSWRTVVPVEDLNYRVEWWRLTEDGAWLVRVFDPSDVLVEAAVAVADSPADALLAVAERLLPPPRSKKLRQAQLSTLAAPALSDIPAPTRRRTEGRSSWAAATRVAATAECDRPREEPENRNNQHDLNHPPEPGQRTHLSPNRACSPAYPQNEAYRCWSFRITDHLEKYRRIWRRQQDRASTDRTQRNAAIGTALVGLEVTLKW